MVPTQKQIRGAHILAETSGINWTDSSFAPWRGCQAISAACSACYAERIDKRGGLGSAWGPRDIRQRTSRDYWRRALKWNRQALATGQPRRVFASHLSGIFDNRADPAWRADLWQLVCATPALTWLVLTKRIQNAPDMLPADWHNGYPNVWLGVTVDDMTEAARRIPLLLDIPARVHWLSCEPLLEALDLSPWLGPDRIAWVIAGGESAGRSARPMHPGWVRSLRDQCAAQGASLWVKQIGSGGHHLWPGTITGKGEDLVSLPADLQVRELPAISHNPMRWGHPNFVTPV